MSETKKSGKGWLVVGVLAIFLPIAGMLAMIGGVLLFTSFAAGGSNADTGQEATMCAPGEPVLPVDGTIPLEVAGYSGVALQNAATIMRAGADLDVSRRGQTIAVMTAMGESSLQVLDEGDAVGPDSRGLFQQRDNGAWGSYEDRMDPYRSSQSFYTALVAVPQWETMEPTLAAHAVQRNADPYHYESHWAAAEAVVAALAGETGDQLFGASATTPCGTVGAPGDIVGGWTVPIPHVKVSSGFGMRLHPISGKWLLHAGVDLPSACGTSVYAASGGTVIWAGLARPGSGRTGNQIEIDHGAGIVTTYGHVLTGTFAVKVGDVVTPGQLIAGVGGEPDIDPVGAGSSTGCHLHFQTNEGGGWVDPVGFMAARGITFGMGNTIVGGDPGTGGSGGGQTALAFAQSQIGDRYSQTEQGGCGPDWWDCSCLVRESWAQAGKALPRVTRDQYAATTRIPRDQLQVGDLIFWSSNNTPGGIYHVAMYAGDGKVIHAPRPGRHVEVVTIWEPNIFGHGRV